jgi:hypothetical protein
MEQDVAAGCIFARISLQAHLSGVTNLSTSPSWLV